jgi:nitrate reductase cytochrome c-type subunit
MKGAVRGLIAAAIIASSATASAQTVVGSTHDFYGGPNTSYNFYSLSRQVCSACHTAHNAIATDAPLWNHTASVGPWTMYTDQTSATLDNVVAGTPQGVSKACLGCHDGTVAINSVRGQIVTNANVPAAVFIQPGTDPYIGTDLTDDHPISITYDNTVDPGLFDPSTVTPYFPLYGLNKNQVECGSCHDPHTPGGGGLYLRGYTASGKQTRCLVCHNK